MNFPASENAILLVNGEPRSQVDAADRGFQYGDGIFTTLAVRQGVPLFLEAHLDRLERDGPRLALPLPKRAVLADEARRLCALQADGVLKIQVTRGSGGRGYRCPENPTGTRVLGMHPPPDYPPELSEQGVEVRVCRTRLGINPGLAGIKHMNRLEQILARAEWPVGGIREGLMLDTDGHVVEGTMTNLFIARAGRLLTPRVDRCGVAGFMRGLLMSGASELGWEVEEGRLTLGEVAAADEVFLTNSVIGLWPVRRMEARAYPIGPITSAVREWLKTKIQEQLRLAADSPAS